MTTTSVQSFVHAWEPMESREDPRALILLHGTGGDETSLLRLGSMLDPRASRLAPRGKVLEGTMPRFFRRLREGVFDVEDVKFRAGELADWIVEASRHYGLASDRTTVVGYSNGANIASAMLLLRPGVIRRAVLLRPMVAVVPERVPDLRGVRVLLCVGRRDPITPASSAAELADLLRRCGAVVDLVMDDGDHALPREAVEAARDWLQRHEDHGASVDIAGQGLV